LSVFIRQNIRRFLADGLEVRGLRFGILILSATSLAGFASARSARLYWCSQALPGFAAQLAQARHELGPGARGPASALDEAARDRWQQWAERQLSEAQRYKDLSDRDPGLREASRELSRVATEIVEFHGLAQLGRRVQMDALVTAIAARVARVRGLACAEPPPTR
jgi:hypothetical protein